MTVYVFNLWWIVVLSVLLGACVQRQTNKPAELQGDSVAKVYLRTTRAFPYFDTNNLSDPVLKAIAANDSAELHGALRGLAQLQIDFSPNHFDSCMVSRNLEKFGFDEAYRIAYIDTALHVVIIGTGPQQVKLRTFLYTMPAKEGSCPPLADSSSECLSDSAWTEFKTKLRYVDYWGMQQQNGDKGSHGDYLEVVGWRKVKMENEMVGQRKMVYRIYPKKLAVFELYRLALSFRLHGIQKCD